MPQPESTANPFYAPIGLGHNLAAGTDTAAQASGRWAGRSHEWVWSPELRRHGYMRAENERDWLTEAQFVAVFGFDEPPTQERTEEMPGPQMNATFKFRVLTTGRSGSVRMNRQTGTGKTAAELREAAGRGVGIMRVCRYDAYADTHGRHFIPEPSDYGLYHNIFHPVNFLAYLDSLETPQRMTATTLAGTIAQYIPIDDSAITYTDGPGDSTHGMVSINNFSTPHAPNSRPLRNLTGTTLNNILESPDDYEAFYDALGCFTAMLGFSFVGDAPWWNPEISFDFRTFHRTTGHEAGPSNVGLREMLNRQWLPQSTEEVFTGDAYTTICGLGDDLQTYSFGQPGIIYNSLTEEIRNECLGHIVMSQQTHSAVIMPRFMEPRNLRTMVSFALHSGVERIALPHRPLTTTSSYLTPTDTLSMLALYLPNGWQIDSATPEFVFVRRAA